MIQTLYALTYLPLYDSCMNVYAYLENQTMHYFRFVVVFGFSSSKAEICFRERFCDLGLKLMIS